MPTGKARDYLPLLVAAAFIAVPIAQAAGILAALPLLLLALPLSLGRYPGERILSRARDRRRPSRRRTRLAVPEPAFADAPSVLTPRLLIAASLAGRAPPLVLAV